MNRLFLIGLTLLLLIGCEAKEKTSLPLTPVQIEQFLEDFFIRPGGFKPAPEFHFKDLRSKDQTFKPNSGKLVMLNFWATWCEPCLYEMPDFEALHQKYSTQGLKILAINHKETLAKTQGYLKKHPLSFEIGLDPNDTIAKKYLVEGLPTTFILDQNGAMLGVAVGPRRWQSPKFHAFIERMLHNQP